MKLLSGKFEGRLLLLHVRGVQEETARLLSVSLSADALGEPAATAITKVRDPYVVPHSPVSPHYQASYAVLTFHVGSEYPTGERTDDIYNKLLLTSSGTRPPRGHDQNLQRAIAEVYHTRQQNHNMSRRNQQLMRIARQEEAARQHLSKQNEQLQRVSVQEQVNKQKQASRQTLGQLGPVTIQGRANNQDLSQQVEHLQGTYMQKEIKHQDLSQQIEHLKGTVNFLIVLVEQLRGLNSREHLAKLTVIKNVVVSNANIEAAVDAREAEMRVGLSNLWGNPEQMKGQAMQLLDYSNTTSSLVSRLVVGAMLEHQGFLSNEEHKAVELQYDNAEPNPEVAAIMAEKLTFMLDGPDRSHFARLDL